MFCNVITPNIFWFKKCRTSIPIMWVAAILVNIGMWCERFIIIVTSLHQDFLPSSWDMYAPTWVDWTIYVGTLGLFGTLFLLFLKFVPAVAISEVKELQLRAQARRPPRHSHGAEHGRRRHSHPRSALEPWIPRSSIAGCWPSSPRPMQLVKATNEMRLKGFQGMDTYSPYPLHGGSEALGLPPSKVPLIALCGAITGVRHRAGHADVDEHHRLPPQRGWPSAAEPPGVDPHHLRAGGAAARPSASSSACWR